MTRFTYNPADLTADQLSAISAAQVSYDKTIKDLDEQEDARMQHYYDCIDDYSWGGLCTKANYLARGRAKQTLEDRIEEIVRGGFLIRERLVNVLRDINTNEVVATGTHEGRYGRFFVTEDGVFVSCAKKVGTYEKKGFRPYVQTITEKVVRDGYWRNGDHRYKAIETISVVEELTTDIVY